jgi:hypothetical protein
MEPSVDKVIGNSMIVVGIFYTVARVLHIVGDKISGLAGVDKDEVNENMRTFKGLMKATAKATAFYITIVVAVFLIMSLCIFYYCALFTPGGFSAAATRTISLLNTILWRNGELLFLYINISVSLLVMFLIIAIYAFQNKNDFVGKLKLPTTATDDNDSPNQETLFYKHYILLVFVIFLFLFMMQILGLWNVCKTSLVYYILLLLGIVITTVVSYEKYWLPTLVYAMILATYMKTLHTSC